MLSKAFIHITSYGVSGNLDYEDKARVTLMNAVSIMLILALLLAALGLSLYGSYASLKSLILLPVLILIPFLHRMEWYSLSKYLFIFGLYGLCFTIAVTNRREGVEYGLLTVAIFSVYTFKEWHIIVLAFISGLVLFLIYFYIDQHTVFIPHRDINYSVNSIVYLLIGILAIFFEMMFFKKVVQYYSDSAKKNSERLNHANEELNVLNEGLDAAIKERTRDLEVKTYELNNQKTQLNQLVLELDQKNSKLNTTILTLQQRNYEMDQIIYRLSHNLKAPLCSVAGLCNLMQIDMNLEFVAEALPKINLKIEEMENVFRSVSSLTSINNQNLILSEFSLDGLIEDVGVKFKEIADKEDFTITVEKSNQVLHTDRRMLYVVVYHLIQNAILYQNKKRQGELRINFYPTVNTMSITFRDNGMGIPDHLHNKVFDMFFRGTEQSNGSGLGLYIVKEIVSRLGGTVELMSVTIGTEVRITIPLIMNEELN